jgi:hypothetical protein
VKGVKRKLEKDGGGGKDGVCCVPKVHMEQLHLVMRCELSQLFEDVCTVHHTAQTSHSII